MPTIDMPATVFLVPVAGYVLWRYPRKALTWALLGAAVPLGIHAGILWHLTGSILPVQLDREAYLYPAGYWRHRIGTDALTEPKGTYLFHMTFGRSGLFSLYPVLLLGAGATLRALVRRDSPWRGEILGGAAAFLVMTAYYAINTNNYGGAAYGFRWYIPAMPVLLLMGAPLLADVRARWKWVFISLMVGISFYSAWQCTTMP